MKLLLIIFSTSILFCIFQSCQKGGDSTFEGSIMYSSSGQPVKARITVVERSKRKDDSSIAQNAVNNDGTFKIIYKMKRRSGFTYYAVFQELDSTGIVIGPWIAKEDLPKKKNSAVIRI